MLNLLKLILMKRFTIAVLSLSALFFASCGGGGNTNSAISEAEKAVSIVSDPVFGELPSLEEQYKAAKIALKKEIEVKFRAIDDKDMDKASEKADKLKTEKKAAEEALKAHYEPKIKAAAEKLIGVKIPCTVDVAKYASAEAEISGVDGDRPQIKIAVTLAVALGRTPYIIWQYRDAADKKVSQGAEYLPKGEYKADAVVTVTTPVSASEMVGVASIYVGE